MSYIYGLLIAIGALLTLHLADTLGKKEKLHSAMIWKIGFRAIFYGVIGARLYHVIDFWELYSMNPISSFYVWNGGLGIIGGIFGGIWAIYTTAPRKYLLKILDIFASCMPLAQAMGRWGNYFNNELLPYAIYESISDLTLFIGLQVLIRKYKPKDGIVFFSYLIGYSIIRLSLDMFHNSRWTISVGNWNNFNITQTIAILTLLISIGAIWKIKKSKS